MKTQTTGQSTVEYAVTVAVVVGALLLMQIYMKRGIMGRARTATDQIGEQFTPENYSEDYSTFSAGTRTENTTAQGVSTSTIAVAEQQKRLGFGATDINDATGGGTETIGAIPENEGQ